jgi:regulator of nucleoside diphosphate kinase
VLKYANGSDPSRDPIPRCGSPARPDGFFLDFDPVCPGWPPGQQDSRPADPDTFAPRAAEAAVITIDDFRRLKAVIRTARMRWCLRGYPNHLERKLRRARIVHPLDVPADVVTMNSIARVFDAVSGTHAPLTLAYPHRAASDHRSVSVLSPTGTAILGHRTGQTAGPRIDQSSRRFVIENVLYQPEAAGDLHL